MNEKTLLLVFFFSLNFYLSLAFFFVILIEYLFQIKCKVNEAVVSDGEIAEMERSINELRINMRELDDRIRTLNNDISCVVTLMM